MYRFNIYIYIYFDREMLGKIFQFHKVSLSTHVYHMHTHRDATLHWMTQELLH